MSLLITRVLIIVSAGLMATAFGLHAKAVALAIVLLIGGIWLMNTFSKGGTISSVAFVLMVGAAAYGVLMGSSPWPWLLVVLISTISIIAAWDLEQLAKRLARFDRIEGPIETEHIKRLALVSLLASSVSGAALSVKVNLGFSMALFAGIVLILALISTLRLASKMTD